MNAMQTIHYAYRNMVPVVNQATYLGTTITANGNYHAEISARIAASLTTFKTLHLLEQHTTFQQMENESLRCRYNHKIALWTRVSIIIKHRQKATRRLSKQRAQENPRNQTCLLFQNKKSTGYRNSQPRSET